MRNSLALDGHYLEREVPLLIRREGMARWDDGCVRILDRRRLPHERVVITCTTVEEVAGAIEGMAIQGAFTLAIAAGYGLALAAPRGPGDGLTAVRIHSAAERLAGTRPTGSALRRLLRVAVTAADDRIAAGGDPVDAIVTTIDRAAAALARQALLAARAASGLVRDGEPILTHCFADRTLLYLLLEARSAGKVIPVYCSETRPYLQGARLTALSVLEIGHPVTLITDGMGGLVLREGLARLLVTGADRVCLDGTICNKVGTYQFALAAHANGVPYYVLRPSGPDPDSLGETDVTIEYRDEDAVLSWRGTRIAPEGARGLYPAFDVTPATFVSGVVTDRGILPAGGVREYFDRPAAVSDALF